MDRGLGGPGFEERVISMLSEQRADMENINRLRDEDRRAFEQERRDSHESRTELHRKIDAAVGQVSQVRTDVAISAQISAQTRDEVIELKVTVEKNAAAVQPTVEQVQAVMSIGKVALWIVGGGAVAIVAAGVTFGGLARQLISNWLGLK